MLYFSLMSFSIVKYSSFVTGFIAQPQGLSSTLDQYMSCQVPSHGGSYMDEGTLTLGLDYSPSLFQGTALLMFSLYAFLLDCSRVSDVQ